MREGVLDGAVLERLTLVVLKQTKAMASSVQRCVVLFRVEHG